MGFSSPQHHTARAAAALSCCVRVLGDIAARVTVQPPLCVFVCVIALFCSAKNLSTRVSVDVAWERCVSFKNNNNKEGREKNAGSVGGQVSCVTFTFFAHVTR